MLKHYFAALLSLGQTPYLAHSALPDAPVRRERKDRRRGRNRRKPAPPPPNLSRALAPAGAPVAAGPNGSTEWDPCLCRQWGVARSDRHDCVAMCKELFPQLDQELDAWEAEHGWLYR
jgi:hypothetical protein